MAQCFSFTFLFFFFSIYDSIHNLINNIGYLSFSQYYLRASIKRVMLSYIISCREDIKSQKAKVYGEWKICKEYIGSIEKENCRICSAIHVALFIQMESKLKLKFKIR